MTDGDIEALYSLAFLIDDRIDRNRGLAGLAVADDQFPLSASDRSHRVDGFDPGLHRLVDRMPFGHSRGDDFDRAANVGGHWSFAVHGIPERIENATDNGIPGRDAQKRSKGTDFIPFFDAQVVAENDDPDGFLFEVKSQPDHAAGEFDHLAGHHPRESVDPGDTITDLKDRSYFAYVNLATELLDFLLNDACNFIRVKLHFFNLANPCPSANCLCSGGTLYSNLMIQTKTLISCVRPAGILRS